MSSSGGEDGTKEEGAPLHACGGGPDISRQVSAFTRLQELEHVIESLGIRNVPLNSLTEDTSLKDAYIGGSVVAESTVGRAEGTVDILLQDKSLIPEQKYITCHLQGDITRLMPESGCAGGRVYIHKAKLRMVGSEFSQELNLSVVVEGEEAKVWIVNSNAGRPDFLPSAEAGQSKRKAKRRRRAKRLQMEERAREEAASEAIAASRERARILEEQSRLAVVCCLVSVE